MYTEKLNSSGIQILGLERNETISDKDMLAAAFVYKVVRDWTGKTYYWIMKDRIGPDGIVSVAKMNNRLSQIREYHKDKPEFCIKNIQPGSTISSKATGLSYIVMDNFGDRLTAVRTVDITNPSEWELIK